MKRPCGTSALTWFQQLSLHPRLHHVVLGAQVVRPGCSHATCSVTRFVYTFSCKGRVDSFYRVKLPRSTVLMHRARSRGHYHYCSANGHEARRHGAGAAVHREPGIMHREPGIVHREPGTRNIPRFRICPSCGADGRGWVARAAGHGRSAWDNRASHAHAPKTSY